MLTEEQHATLSTWWDEQPRKVVQQAYYAAGFMVAYSCMGWRELRREFPDMAEVIGASVIQRHRLRI